MKYRMTRKELEEAGYILCKTSLWMYHRENPEDYPVYRAETGEWIGQHPIGLIPVPENIMFRRIYGKDPRRSLGSPQNIP